MSSKCRVLIIHEAMGGCGHHVVDLVNSLDPRLFDVTVLYGTSRVDDYYRNALSSLSQHTWMIPCDALTRDIDPSQEIRALIQTIRLIRTIRPDVVHCHSSKAGVIGRVAAKLMHVRKVFYTPHAYSFQAPEFDGKKRAMFIAIERWLSRHATTLTFNVSEGERQAALQERIDMPAKLRTIYNGIADITVPGRSEARTRLGIDVSPETPVIGVTARLVDQKDPMASLNIASEVLRRRADAHMVYVGDGEYESAMRIAVAERGLENRVHFLGYRADAELLVAAFDVYLLTSRYEGMPYSLVEALRAGVPIAATRVTGNDEVVLPGINGLLFPVGDVPAGVAAVMDLLEHPLSPERVRQTYRDRFTLKRMVDAVTEEYLR